MGEGFVVDGGDGDGQFFAPVADFDEDFGRFDVLDFFLFGEVGGFFLFLGVHEGLDNGGGMVGFFCFFGFGGGFLFGLGRRSVALVQLFLRRVGPF